MGMPPLISVIIPTYNRALYLADAIGSVFRQSFTDYEIVVVDDGSTDDSKKIIAPYLDRLRYVYQENMGEAAARNRGIREARGKWVAFLDSDDMWEPRALETLVQASGIYPKAGLIAMRGRMIRTNGTRTERIIGKKSAGPFYSTASLLWGDGGGVLMPMIRKSIFEKTGVFDETIASATDCDMWLRISFHTQMVCVHEPLLLCRLHEDNLSGNKALNARMWLRILEKLRDDHPEFLQTNRCAYRRACGKESLRLGRELLAGPAEGSGDLREARRRLFQSIAFFPFFLRAYLYLGWSYIFPSLYGQWRKWERKHR